MVAIKTPGLTALKAWLANVAPGEITDTSEVERILASAWDDLFRDDGGMEAYKLLNRMEDVTWTPPLLRFRIERHGATVMGSSRAEMQKWSIDVEKGTACCESKGYRQLSPRQPPLDVKPLAEEIAAAIVHHIEDERLKWVDQETVRVKIGLIFPKGSAVKMTLAGRRKRFQTALAERLATHGWVRVGANKFGSSLSISVPLDPGHEAMKMMEYAIIPHGTYQGRVCSRLVRYGVGPNVEVYWDRPTHTHYLRLTWADKTIWVRSDEIEGLKSSAKGKRKPFPVKVTEVTPPEGVIFIGAIGAR